VAVTWPRLTACVLPLQIVFTSGMKEILRAVKKGIAITK